MANETEPTTDEMNDIRDEGNPFKNCTLIPNIIDDMELSVYAARLYVRFKRRVNQNSDGSTNGVATESTRSLSKTCGMSTGQVTKSKLELVEAGLIRIKKVPSSHGEYPRDEITIVDIWEANRIYYSKSIEISFTDGTKRVGKDARAILRKEKHLRLKIPDFIKQYKKIDRLST